ncbi:hypothetical protein MMC34_005239 [Xylographa carneopallida]|nr:hypothetical protein [Xylographa carneopallida]
MDQTYTQVAKVAPSGAFAGQNLTQDLHEFNVIGTAGASALITSYVNFAHNVTYPACPGSPTTPFTKTGLFTEVSTDGLDTALFQWNAIDYVDPTDTYVCPGENNVGTGNNIGDGFDFFHINAVDKDENGDYLVSSRHTSTLFKIAGNKNTEGLAPGSIIWRLGGKRNSFPVMDSTVTGTPNLNFSFQHHARFRPSINGVSLWDNANDNITPASAVASSGMSVTISTSNGTNTATLIEQYVSPDHQLDSSQGSHQFLPNGNHFLGLGSYPYVYEQTSDGTTVFYANWGVLPLQSYRAFKYEWVGKPPITEIALFGYAQNCTAPAAFYASWNGATEVVSWKYFTSSSENGTFALAATAVNNGTFETFTTASFNLFAYAIAYDDLGNMLGQTPTVSVFVPDAVLAPSCNAISCPVGTDYGGASKATCGAPPAPTVVTHKYCKGPSDPKLHDVSGEWKEDPDSIDFLTCPCQEYPFHGQLANQEAKEDSKLVNFSDQAAWQDSHSHSHSNVFSCEGKEDSKFVIFSDQAAWQDPNSHSNVFSCEGKEDPESVDLSNKAANEDTGAFDLTSEASKEKTHSRDIASCASQEDLIFVHITNQEAKEDTDIFNDSGRTSKEDAKPVDLPRETSQEDTHSIYDEDQEANFLPSFKHAKSLELSCCTEILGYAISSCLPRWSCSCSLPWLGHSQPISAKSSTWRINMERIGLRFLSGHEGREFAGIISTSDVFCNLRDCIYCS